MLQNMHEKMKGWAAILIFGVIAVMFAFWGIGSYLEGEHSVKRPVADVGGQKISMLQLNNTVSNVLRGQPQQPSATRKQQLRQLVLQRMIARIALIQYAKQSGFAVAQVDVERYMKSIPAFLRNGVYSPQLFANALMNIGMSPPQFQQRVRDEMLLQQVSDAIAASDLVLPGQLQYFYSLLGQRRSFYYMTIPLSHFAGKINITDKQIKAYYQANKQQFATADRVKMQYLLLSPKAIIQRVAVSKAEVAQYYQNNQQQYSAPARWGFDRLVIKLPLSPTPAQLKLAQTEAATLTAKLKDGQSMMALAKGHADLLYSQQSVSSIEVAGVLAQTLSSLALNDISPAVLTKEGLNIFKLTSLVPHKVKPLSVVRTAIAKHLQQQQAMQIFTSKAQKLSDLTYTNASSLTQAAKALGLTLQTSAWLTRAGVKAGVFANENALQLAFSKNVLAQRNNSNPITLKNSDVLVMRVADYEPSAQKPLASVKQQIIHDQKRQLSSRNAGIEAFKLATALKASDARFERLARKNGFAWHFVKAAKRDDKTVAALLLSTVFSTHISQEKSASLQLANGDYVVFKITAVAPAAVGSQAEAKQQAYSSMQRNHLQSMYNLAAMSKVKVKIYHDALNQN